MKNVSLESSNALAAMSRSVGQIKDVMRDNVTALDDSFAAACERWNDKNSESCKNALEKHNAAMRAALGKLAHMENALARLCELASEYENI